MTLNGGMAVILRYFTEFGKHAFQHIASICDGGIYARVYFVVRVRCRGKESSRSLSHLLMSFLFLYLRLWKIIGYIGLYFNGVASKLTCFH